MVRSQATRAVDLVVKCGGGLLGDRTTLDAVTAQLRHAATTVRILVIPGGGLFADAIRLLDQRLALSADTAHWMAIRAMDAYACLLADALQSEVVTSPQAIGDVCGTGRCAVLAPYTWLREEDPLPHEWEVTSDSLAAWIAARLSAARLILVKPPAARPPYTDGFFESVATGSVERLIVTADRLDLLQCALRLPLAGAG